MDLFTGQLGFLAAREHVRELQARHGAPTALHGSPVSAASLESPVTRVTLRFAAAADADRLRRLAELDSAAPPSGPALVAEIDGRLRAALPLDGGPAISDPFHRGVELVELLRLRALQLT
jgi:hypothetical protein